MLKITFVRVPSPRQLEPVRLRKLKIRSFSRIPSHFRSDVRTHVRIDQGLQYPGQARDSEHRTRRRSLVQGTGVGSHPDRNHRKYGIHEFRCGRRTDVSDHRGVEIFGHVYRVGGRGGGSDLSETGSDLTLSAYRRRIAKTRNSFCS